MADSKKFDLLNIWRDKRAPSSELQSIASSATSPNCSIRNFADVVALFDSASLASVPSSDKKEHAHFLVLHAAQAAVEHIDRLAGASDISRDALKELWDRVSAHKSDAWEDLRTMVFKFIQACLRFQLCSLGQELSVLASFRPVFFDLLFKHSGDELLVTRTLEKLVEHSALPFERYLPMLIGRLIQCEVSSKEATSLAQKLIIQGSFGTFEETGISVCCAAASMPLDRGLPTSVDEPLESHFLDLIKIVQQYRFLPPRVLPLLVTRLCCSVHSELLWKPVTELMRSVLLRRGNLNVMNCMLEILENPMEYATTCDADWQMLLDSCSGSSTQLPPGCMFYKNLRSISHTSLFSSAIVIRGCVFFLTMFTWGPLNLPDLKLPGAVILPAFAAALPDSKTSTAKIFVVTEIVLSIKRLISKYGSQLYFEWEHIFAIIRKISMTLPWKFEAAAFDAFMDTINCMFKMYENGFLLFSGDSLFDEVENFLAHVPQDIQVKCLSHRTNRAHPSFPDWQVQLQRFCDVYLLSVPQYHVKGIALDAIRQFIELFGSLYPNEIACAVVPSLLDLACGSTPVHVFESAGISNLHNEAIQCLLDLAILTKDIQHFAVVFSHIEAVATRKGAFLRYDLTADSVRCAESVHDTLSDSEIFAMQGTLSVFHAVFSDSDPDRLLFLWDTYKKWINHGWGPIRLFTLAACQLISVSDEGRPRLVSSYHVMPRKYSKVLEFDYDNIGFHQSFTTRISPWNTTLLNSSDSNDKIFDVLWLYNACIKCMNIYAPKSDLFSQQVTTSAVQALIIGLTSSFLFDSCNIVPVAVSLCHWLLPQPGHDHITFSQCPPFFSSVFCRNLSVATEDGMQVEFEFLMYDLLSAVISRLAAIIDAGQENKFAATPSSDLNAIFRSCCSALIYGAGCGCRSIPDAVRSLSISASTFTQAFITEDLFIVSDIRVDDSLSSMSTGACFATTCNFAVILASSPNLVMAFFPHFLSVMRLYLSAVLGSLENSSNGSGFQVSPAFDCTLSISLLRQILNVIRVAVRVLPDVCAHQLDIPFILGLAMNDVRVGAVVSHFSHSLMIEWYSCCVTLGKKDQHYAASGQVQSALSIALGAVQPFASRDQGGLDVPASSATIEALICGSLGTMKPAVHSKSQFYFIIGEAIWSAVPLPDGGIFVVIRRGAGCFSWTVSPTVTVPHYLPFALLQSKSNQGHLSHVRHDTGADNTRITPNPDNTIVTPASTLPAVHGCKDNVSISHASVMFPALSTDSTAFSDAVEVFHPLHTDENPPETFPPLFCPAHTETPPNSSSPIIKPMPLSPLITPQSSALTVGRGRTKFISSPSIQPLSFHKISTVPMDGFHTSSSTSPACSSPNYVPYDPSGSKEDAIASDIESAEQPVIQTEKLDHAASSAMSSMQAVDKNPTEVVECVSATALTPSSGSIGHQLSFSYGCQFSISEGVGSSSATAGHSSMGTGCSSNPFIAHLESEQFTAVRGDSGSAPDSPQSVIPRFSFNQKSLITSPLKRHVINHDQGSPPFDYDQSCPSIENPFPCLSQEARSVHSDSSDIGIEVVHQPVLGNRAFSARSDRSSSIHSVGLPSYDDDCHGLDLLAANTTGVLEDNTVASAETHMPHPAPVFPHDSHILDAIPRSPRSILISEGLQHGDQGSQTADTMWWRPGKDLWRKKNLQRLVTQLGAPLPAGSFFSSGRFENASTFAAEQRHADSAASALNLQNSGLHLKPPTSRESCTASPSKESPASGVPSIQGSPKTSPSKSHSNFVDDDVCSSSDRAHDDSPSHTASASSRADARSTFFDGQAPLILGHSSSLIREPIDNSNASQSHAATWLHVIMQLIPPPISAFNSVETLSAADSATASAMNILDKTPSCDCVRVALIFVGSSGSSAAPSYRFMQLVHGLGRLESLATAADRNVFTGGLDTTGSRHGSSALHCSSASAQVVFYVPALMQLELGCAFDASTKQSIDGLIGNCFVTIVYTENEFEAEERSRLLVGDFHWLVITVQPVSGSRNRVIGKMKPGHPQLSVFGPTAKIVSDEALPALLQVYSSFFFPVTSHNDLCSSAVCRDGCGCRLPHHINWRRELRFISSRENR
jgi:hypothetical protein